MSSLAIIVVLIGSIGGAVVYLLNMLRGKVQDAAVTTLTTDIEKKKAEEAQAAQTAADSLKAYEELKKQYTNPDNK